MYHPYQQFKEEQCHPYEYYYKPNQSLRSNHLSRGNPRTRSSHSNTVGYHATPDNAVPLAQWTPFVEGVRGGCSTLPHVHRIRKDQIRLQQDGGMEIKDILQGKEALVVFVVLDCPTCQDTKQMWEAYAIEASWIRSGDESEKRKVLCTPKVSATFWKRADGRLSAWRGKINAMRMNRVINSLCLA